MGLPELVGRREFERRPTHVVVVELEAESGRADEALCARQPPELAERVDPTSWRELRVALERLLAPSGASATPR